MKTYKKWTRRWDYCLEKRVWVAHPKGYPYFWHVDWALWNTFSKEELKKFPPGMRSRKWIPTEVVFASDLSQGKRDFYEVPLNEFWCLDIPTLRYMRQEKF